MHHGRAGRQMMSPLASPFCHLTVIHSVSGRGCARCRIRVSQGANLVFCDREIELEIGK